MTNSYPKKYETVIATEEGIEALVRPIKAEDASRLVEFFNSLSPATVLFRFLSPIKALSPEMIKRFTEIDYGRDVALVVMQKDDASEKFIAVARIMRKSGNPKGEFAIVVTDSWQGRGIGAELLKLCLSIAKDLGMKEVWGMAMRGNIVMIAVARKLGFNVRKIPESDEYEMTMTLDAESALGNDQRAN